MWSKVFDPLQYVALQSQIVVTLCELEMYFPPAFFDMMMHLPIHLVREMQLCGPPFLRSMYPVERYMKVLKGYVKNRNRPEGCIVERYIVDEAIAFCTEYLGVNIAGNDMSEADTKEDGGKVGEKLVTISAADRAQAHLYVLHNTDEVDPYVIDHKKELKMSNPHRNDTWIAKEHNRSFASWFRMKVMGTMNNPNNSVPTRLIQLAKGPGQCVFTYSSYRFNGRTFYTKDHDERSTTQNSGVSLKGQTMHSGVITQETYYGVIEAIWKLDYGTLWIPVFRCLWVDNRNGVLNDVGFTRVNLKKVGYTDEPFILASQAKKVFYVDDPINKSWSIVLSVNKALCDEDADWDIEDDDEQPDLHKSSINPEDEVDGSSDDEFYVRNDHNEGIIVINSSECQARNACYSIAQPKRKKKG